MRRLCLVAALLCSGCAVTPAGLEKQLKPVNSQLEELNREGVEQSMRLSMLENSVQDVLEELRSNPQAVKGKGKQAPARQASAPAVVPPPVVSAQPGPAMASAAPAKPGYVPPPGHAATVPPPVVAGKDVGKGELYTGPVAIKVPPAGDVALETVPGGQTPASTVAPAVAPGTAPAAVSPVPQPAPAQASPAAPVQTATPAYVAPPQTQVQASPPVAQPAPVVRSEDSAYKQALAAYEGRRYADAESQFNAYLAAYPQGKYVPNSLYWKGESYFAQQRFAEAILAFKETAARFPKHHKAADSLLKMVMIYNKLGDAGNAALYLRILKEDFPNSEALRRAEKLVAAAPNTK